jgi:hypothetical protein
MSIRCTTEHVIYIRSLNIAEPCAYNLKSRVALQGYPAHFRANMLALTITIGPDKQDLGITSLSFDIVGDALLVFSNIGLHRRIKKIGRIALSPFPVAIGKIRIHNMAYHAGEHHAALAPAFKIVIEYIVFDIGIAMNIVLVPSEFSLQKGEIGGTHRLSPTA